jgi:hypothetical protein
VAFVDRWSLCIDGVAVDRVLQPTTLLRSRLAGRFCEGIDRNDEALYKLVACFSPGIGIVSQQTIK